MIAFATLGCILLATGELTLEPVRTTGDPAAAWFVAGGNEMPARLLVLDGYQMRLLRFDQRTVSFGTLLPEDSSAVDAADIDGDGALDVVVAAGTEFRAFPLESDTAARPWRVLFDSSAESFSGAAWPRYLPFLGTFEGQHTVTTFSGISPTLRGLDGSLISGADEVQDSSEFSLTRRIVDPPRIGNMNAIEFVVTARQGIQIVEEIRDEDRRNRGRPGTPEQMREAASLSPAVWPWYPLSRNGEAMVRVLYALDGPAAEHTLIRLWQLQDQPEPGPQRRYPGAIIPPGESPPDMNGDGHADLLLWSTPSPGSSFTSISRAVRKRTWRVQLAVHLFDPERGLYDARPAGRIRTELPVAWFLTRFGVHPLRNFYCGDLNGDGRGDIAFSRDADTMHLWCYEEGFATTPTHTIDLPDPKTELIDIARPSGGNGAILLFRGPEAYYHTRVAAGDAP